MRTKIIEATNGPQNWGKFMIGIFDHELRRKTRIPLDETKFFMEPLLRSRGWSEDHVLVLDLQTGEGAMFRIGGLAAADLDKHKIWVCPLFEPFLEWLYATLSAKLPYDYDGLPEHIDLPTAPFAMHGYRRPGKKK